MLKLLKQYPQGKVFNFSVDGELQTSDSSSEDALSLSRPEHPDRHTSQETRAYSVPLNKARRKPVSREREGKIIAAAFPNARSVAFFPVWDPRQERWRAGGLIYTNAPFRTFTVQGELSYLRAFGMLAVDEIMRLEALQDAKIKSDALGSLSHELRSPLHGVLLGTELMADTKLNIFQTNIAHTIETCSRTLLDTINHLLDYSRVNSFANGGMKSISNHSSRPEVPTSQSIGKNALVTDYFVDQLVEDVVESVFAGFNFQQKSIVQHVSRQKKNKQDAGSTLDYADNVANSTTDYQEAMDQLTPGISGNTESPFALQIVTIILSLDAQCDWLFRFHVGAVRRIVMNIVGNALKYTPDGSINIMLTRQVASIRRRKPEQVVCLTFKDTGKGISEDFLKNTIFKPFSQDDLSPGTGIGLSLVKQIVSQFKGQISIESQVGVGTTVTVLLPLEKPKLPQDGVFSDAQAGFSDQVRDLAGLRLRLMLGSTDTSVSADHRKNLEHICKDWLKLELLAQDDESKKPDLILWTQDVLPPTSKFTKSLALIPNVVICLNALAAYDKEKECNEGGWRGIFEFVAEP
jgi:signal transduction histidine kinase